MAESDRKLRVFLCHSSHDKPTVRDLYRRLDAEGWIDAWLDSEKLYPGQDWNFEIEKAVEESDVILICLTKNSVNKEGYIQRELRIVLDLADYKPEGTLFVIPVRLDECDPPRRLRSWQYADYFPKENRDIAYRRLLVSLKMRAQKLEISTDNPDEEKAHLSSLKKEWLKEEDSKHKQTKENHRKAPEPKKPQTEMIVDKPVGYKVALASQRRDSYSPEKSRPFVFYLGGAGVLVTLVCLIFGVNYLIKNVFTKGTPTPIGVTPLFTATYTPTHAIDPPLKCEAGTFIFTGSDRQFGLAGNIKTFTVNDVNVNVSGWSRDKTTDTYAPAYVGAYPNGLGVTDLVSDGDGSKNQHGLDNSGADNYLLFEFDRPVAVDKIHLGFMFVKSDVTVWFGNAPSEANPYTNHQTLSGDFLNGLIDKSSWAWVDINGGMQFGNILVVAPQIDDSNDNFKVDKLTTTCPN